MRAFSLVLPAPAWAFIPLGAITGAFFPREPERELLWAGRRLGAGGRLAALWLLLARGEEELAGLLLGELETRKHGWIGLFSGRGAYLTILITGLSLVAFLLVPNPSTSGPAPFLQPPEESVTAQAELPPEVEAQAGMPSPPAAPERMEFPDDFASVPLQDLLAEIYGLAPGEAPGATGQLEGEIEAQRGLLRKLSQTLFRLAPGGLSPEERKAVLPLIQQVARKDLREELLRLVERGDQGAAEEAAQAVEAVRRAGEEVAKRGASSAEASRGPSEEDSKGETAPPPTAVEGGAPSGVDLDHWLWGEERKEGELAGLAPGEDEIETTERSPEGVQAHPISPEVRPGEGPARGYLAMGVPVESGGEVPSAGGTYSPERAELVLRERGVPLELRGVVRQYFELLAQGGSR
ncbi:TPA: hypothetical protein DCL37_03415 [Candidatus Acetothermia bacterium]|nr:hypothetical protein [Candidatus Acetothermia bacterium]